MVHAYWSPVLHCGTENGAGGGRFENGAREGTEEWCWGGRLRIVLVIIT